MKNRAFVRYSKQGKIVPGSLILTGGSYPNGPATWKEVPADLCCNTCLCYTITALVTSTPQYYDCNNVLQTASELEADETVNVCATRIVASDDYTYEAGDACNVVYECPINP